MVLANAVVAYPGYISASAQALTTPFEVDFSIPFMVNYTNYRNNDYQQKLAVIVDRSLFANINLDSADRTLRDAVWGASLDWKPGRTLNPNWEQAQTPRQILVKM